MKAVFITFNQALTDRVHEMLDTLEVRGFTKWDLTLGRGTTDGEPHYGTHAWPSMNASILAVVEESKVAEIMAEMKKIDDATKMQGSKLFTWNIEQMM
ncbi:MAG: PG0541 family transporter-associated protein [Rikenellaceae bacterium]